MKGERRKRNMKRTPFVVRVSLWVSIAFCFCMQMNAMERDAISDLSRWTSASEASVDRDDPRGPRRLPQSGKLHFEYKTPQDWRDYEAIEFDLSLPVAVQCEAEVIVRFDCTERYNTEGYELIYPNEASYAVTFLGETTTRFSIPLGHFTMGMPMPGVWEYVKGVSISITPASGGVTEDMTLDRVRLMRPRILNVSCPSRSQSVKSGESARYEFTVSNPGNSSLRVQCDIVDNPRSILPVDVSPRVFDLSPGESRECKMEVNMTDDVSVGGNEDTLLRIVPNGKATEAIDLRFTTVHYYQHPYLLLDGAGWDRARKKAENYSWAHEAMEALLTRAAQSEVPVFSSHLDKVFDSFQVADILRDTAMAWMLTGEKEYLDKTIEFLRKFSDPERGYGVKPFACTERGPGADFGVHEGIFFRSLAIAYDLVYECGELSREEQKRLDQLLYKYLEKADEFLLGGMVYNYAVCVDTGAILCSLVLQDMERLERFLHGTGGYFDQFSTIVMNDGWSAEGATSYHFLIHSDFMLVAQACNNWGIELIHEKIPANYNRQRPSGSAWPGYLGMSFETWGPPGKPYRCLRDMFDGLIPFMDEDGYVVANNDSHRSKSTSLYEQAYLHFRNPSYAWVIQRGDRNDWRSLLYGVEQLPDAKDPRTESACALNIGLATLRSQTPGRRDDEQIVATLKWGTHGGWHGHFDRCSLLAMRRYGVDFYNPEASWFGYISDEYKMWVQASASHNMVVVDELQQEPRPSEMLLFHGGEAMQVCISETRARWCEVPDWQKFYPVTIYSDGIHKEDTGISYDPGFKPVLQRRMLLVADDYLLVGDFLKAEQKHTYDWLIHPVGFLGMEAESSQMTGHRDRASDKAVSSYKCIQDCDYYRIKTPAEWSFKDAHLDIRVTPLWPTEMEAMMGSYPGSDGKRSTLALRTAGKTTQYMVLIEPFKDDAKVSKAVFEEPGRVRVELKDGRVQTFLLRNFASESKDVQIEFSESRDGSLVRKEMAVTDN